MTIVFDSIHFNTIRYTKKCCVPYFLAYDYCFHMTIFFNSNHFKHNNIYHLVLCAKFHGKQTKFQLLFTRKSLKRLKKPRKRNLVRNFKHMTIVFDSNHFNRITYAYQCCVPSFVANKPSFNRFARKCPKGLKKPKHCYLSRNFRHMNTVFDSKHFKHNNI